jgi:predicted O-methyltransferase YrrM
MKKFRKAFFSLTKDLYDKNGHKNIKKNTELYNTLIEYLKSTESTGCSYSDYWILYSHVRKYKPKEILECGTGVSTIVMARALLENEKEGGGKGRVTSMEEQQLWYEHAIRIIPDYLRDYVDVILSDKAEYCYSIFRGVGYRDLPEREYEFVFVDGPEMTAPSDGTMSFDFDYINVVMKSDKPVFGIVDKRLATSYVIQKIFGLDKVKYDPKRDLCFVGPCTKKDLRRRVSTSAFSRSLRVLGRTELHLRMGL